MFDAIFAFFRSLFAVPAEERLPIAVRAEEKRDLLKPRR